MMMNYFGARTDFVVRQDYASKSNFGVGQGAKAFGETNLVASCRMSVLSLVSIASRFSARSEILRVRRGSAASRKTKGRPEMYTAYGYIYSRYRKNGQEAVTDRLLPGREPDDMRGIGGVRFASQDREDGAETLGARLGHPKDIQVAKAGSTKVGSAVDVDVEVEGTTWGPM